MAVYRVPVIKAIRVTGATCKAAGLYQRLSRHRAREAPAEELAIAEYDRKNNPDNKNMATELKTPLADPPSKATIVGTLKDGYVRNVPLPIVPQIQSASPTTSYEWIAPKTGITLPGYLQVPSWIPTLPKIGSILVFSQRLL